MPRISSLAVGLLASLVFAAPGLGAEATFRVGNWVGEVRRDASGAFDFCAVSVRNRAEVFLTLEMDASGRLDLALSSRLSTLNRGDYIGAKLIIDNRAIGGFFGRVLSREMMKINLHGPATLRHRIARSRLLGVRIAGEEHGFAMDDSGRAMAALDTCVAAARETKPAVEPVARPARSHKSVPRPTTKPALAETPAPGATRAARKPDPPARTASLPDPHPFGEGRRWTLPAEKSAWEDAVRKLMAAAGHDDVIFVSRRVMRETAGFDAALGWVAGKALGFIQPLADRASLPGFVTESLLPAMETHCPGALTPGPMRRAEAADILVFEQSATCRDSPEGLGVHSLLMILPGEGPHLLGFSRADRGAAATPELKLLRSLVTTGTRPG